MAEVEVTNYTPSLTVRNFMLDKSFVRGIMGPVGCTPADTEFLSPTGWVAIGDYKGEAVAVWSEDGKLVFEQPEKYIVGEAQEDFYRFHNKNSLDMVLSPGHRVPHYNWSGEFKVETAEKIAQHMSRRQIPVNYKLQRGTELSYTDTEIRLAVAINADGHVRKTGRPGRVTICVRKSRKKARLKILLEVLGIRWTERVYAARPTETSYDFDVPQDDLFTQKNYSGVWWRASAKQLEIILQECLLWDGLANHEEQRFYSVKKCDADFIQYAAHGCGRRASINISKDRDANECFVVQITTEGSPKTKVGLRVDTTQLERVTSTDGRMYCFTTSTGFFLARHNGRIFVTGNSGKSVGCLMDIAKLAKEQMPNIEGIRRTKFAIIRNTQQQLLDTTLQTWLQWFPDGRAGRWKVSDKIFQLRFDDVECDILFRPLDTADDVDRLLSLELTGAYINEAREIPLEIFDALKSRVGRYPAKKDEGCTRKSIIFDTNPPDIDHWIHELFEKKRPESFALFRQPSGLSPLAENIENLPDRYYEDMMDGKDADDEFINVQVHGNYGRSKSGKPVWPMYRDNFHVLKEDLMPTPKVMIVIGMDFGLNPAAVFKMKDAWGHVYTLDAIHAEGMGLRRFVDLKLKPLIAEKYATNEIVIMGDPSGVIRTEITEVSCFGYLKSIGFAAFPAPTNDIAPRLEATEDLLTRLAQDGYPQWMISPHVQWLRDAMKGGYRFKKQKGTGLYSPTPDKMSVHSHIADANQYVDMYYTYGLSHRGIKPKLEDLMTSTVNIADSSCGY